MLTKMKKVFFVVMFAAFALVFAACGDGGLEKALKGFEAQLEPEVEFGFTLPEAELEGAVTTWESNNEAIVVDETGTYAEVFRPSGADAQVTLTATITLGEKVASKEFVITVKKLLAPDKITIKPMLKANIFAKDETENNTYLLKKGETAKLRIEVADEEMSTVVTWTSGKAAKVSVDEEGNITAKDYGKSTITAQSTTAGADGACQFDRITIKVVEDFNPRQVLLNNKKFIEEAMPKFVYEDTEFPISENPDVNVTYADAAGNELYGGFYKWTEGVDREEIIYVTVSYMGEETDFKCPIKVVTDPDNNEFLALEYAKAELDKILNPFVKDGKKVNENFAVPATFSKDVAKFDVTVSYDQETSYQPYPIKFGNIGTEEAEEFGLIYTKPNDDAFVKIIIYCSTENNNAVYRYTVKAAGYTQDEIVEYVKANSLPQLDENSQYSTTGSHVTLATADTTGRFGTIDVKWASANEEVLTAGGKFANPYLAEETKVKLTATITYGGTVDASFGFTKDVEYEFVVKPAANKAQAIALELSNYLEKPEFLDKIKYFPFGDLTRNADRALVNIMPLPNKISDVTTEAMKDYQDLDIVWAAAEEGLLSADHKLLKQYLRYHEVALTYSVTFEGNTATNEIVINVGLAEKKDTIYIGGNFLYYQAGTYPHNADCLSQLSKFDKPVGDCSKGTKTWGFSYGHGEFSGYTYYIDQLDKETGKMMRYQWYLAMEMVLVLDDGYKINMETGEFSGVKESPANANSRWENNWGTMFINTTNHDVVVPMSPFTGGPSAFKDAAGETVKWGANPFNVQRDNGFCIDGYRTAFVTDETDKVVFGNGGGVIQALIDNSKPEAGEDKPILGKADNKVDLYDYYVTIPAGGKAMTFKTQCNNADVNGKFCVTGTQLTFKYVDPYSLSPDGTDEGINSFIHGA